VGGEECKKGKSGVGKYPWLPSKRKSEQEKTGMFRFERDSSSARIRASEKTARLGKARRQRGGSCNGVLCLRARWERSGNKGELVQISSGFPGLKRKG